MIMNKDSKIYIAGHRGMVGSAIKRFLEKQGYTNIVCRSSSELDLTNQQAVANFFEAEKPHYVVLAAAKVGGIVANNTYRAQFIYENMMIQNNVIHQSYVHKVKKLLFLGSSCIYPKMAPQPMTENVLLTGDLEYTNEPYAIAKISGIKMCESYNLRITSYNVCYTKLLRVFNNVKEFHNVKTLLQKSNSGMFFYPSKKIHMLGNKLMGLPALSGVHRLMSFFEILIQLRITSYNVCYTKLLRI